MTFTWEKPPLGARPYWVVIPERMANLCEAIKDGQDYEYIELWSKELVMLAEMKRELDECRKGMMK